MKAYAEVRKEMAEQHAAAVVDDLLACRYCSTPTPWAVLSRCGARCEYCFAQYLRLGYSGERPPPATRPAHLVKGEAERVRQRVAARGGPPNAFAALSLRMQERMAQRQAGQARSVDEVNAMLADAREDTQ